LDEKNIVSPLKAIRLFCVDCCGGSSHEVKLCSSERCSLHNFRFGKNPFLVRELSEEQRAELAERLRRVRKNRGHTT